MRRISPDTLFLSALFVAIVGTSAPALNGDYIYDDWPMRDNARMDGWDDVLSVFGRSSDDYLGARAASHVGAVGYRPLSMLSLILVQVVFPRAPLPHHLVSLALHLCSAWLLFRLLRGLGSSALARPLTLVFALHPVGIEAYGWINGRSDALAALGVLWVASMLVSAPRPARAWGVLGGTLLAVFAKETGLLAVVGLLGVALLPPRNGLPPASWRARLGLVAPGAIGLAVALLARVFALGDVQRTGMSLLSLPDLPRGVVRLVGVMLEALLVPAPRTMQNLGFLLAQPLSLTALALIVIALSASLWLVLRSAWQTLLLLATGVVMVLPSVMVRHAFWLGADRYFYVPLALFILALAFTPRASAWLVSWSARAQALLGVMLALVLAPATYLTAETYRNQSEHILAMMRMRPADPTGFLIGARWLWHREQQTGAQQLLARLPRSGLPPPLASQLATVLGEFGQTAEALRVVADMATRHPEDPFVQLDVVSVMLDQGRMGEAERAAAMLRAMPSFCHAARALVEAHLNTPAFAAAHAAEGRAMLDRVRCD
ncbi:MAG TPA: hypothetical protein VFZ61_23960 [Polyangiales bacterium]